MVSTVYVEEAIRDHPRVQRISERFPRADVVHCDRYTEVFNPKGQNFRLQKSNPALILARKNDGFVMPAPAAYNIGGDANYYFSHMLNCVYDCRYCFLQGMFRSAHYVVFVNYEDYADAIAATLRDEKGGGPVWFFSGYDCDSLAFEPLTGFSGYFLPWFADHRRAHLELRTKSTQVRGLLARGALDNVVVAFSFTPHEVGAALEHKVPAIDLRLRAARRLQDAGWRIGLRFDPLVYLADYRTHYASLVDEVFSALDPGRIHSVGLGSFRMPQTYFKTILRLHPEHPFYAGPFRQEGGMVAYTDAIRREMMEYVARLLLQWVPPSRFHNHEEARC